MRPRTLLPLPLPLLILACALLAACAGPTTFVNINPSAEGQLAFELPAPGVTRVVTRLPEPLAPFRQIVLSNAGPRPVRGIELWGSGGLDLLQLDLTRSGASNAFQPFALLPAQTLSIFADHSAPQAEGRLLGSMLWQNPADVSLAANSLIRKKNAAPQPDGSLVLAGASGDASVEWRFESPYPFSSARLTWSQYPEKPLPRIWISLDGKAWARLDAGSSRIGSARVIDFGSTVAAHTSFLLRLSIDANSPEAADLLLSGLIVETAFEAPATIREWRPGLNEITLKRKSPNDTPLKVQLIPN